MIAKEKAKQLFENNFNVSDKLNKYPMCYDTAKACALICVDEILTELNNYRFNNDIDDTTQIHYYKKVKQEINKL